MSLVTCLTPSHPVKSKSTTKNPQPSMPEFEGAMRRVRQHIMAQPIPERWPSERVGDPRLVPKPYTLAMQYMGKKSDKMKRRRADNGEMTDHTARAANCFILFRMHVHQVSVDLFPAETKALQDKISARAGELWKELSKEAKEQFAREAKEMERFHKVQFPNYKYKPAKNRKLVASMTVASTAKRITELNTPTPTKDLLYADRNRGDDMQMMSALQEAEHKFDCLTVNIPNFSSSFSDSFGSPYSSPGGYTCSPNASGSTSQLSPFSAWQAAHLPQLMEMPLMDSYHTSPFHSSLPPSTPNDRRLHGLTQQQRPSSQPNAIMLRHVHQKIQHQLHFGKAKQSVACRKINLFKEETDVDVDMDMTLQPLCSHLNNASDLLSPSLPNADDPFISSGALLDEDVISTEASSLAQLTSYSSSHIKNSNDDFQSSQTTSSVDSVDVSWLQALHSVGQGFGGACLAVSGGWMDAPLPADLMDIPLRNLEQGVLMD